MIAPSAAAIAHAKLSSKCNILLLQRLKCTLSNKKYQPIIGRYKIIAIYNFGYFANADTDTTANGAKTKAENAVSKAETAIETANGADTKADSATEVASAANTKSDNAVSAANEAKQTASDAANLASTTKTQVEQKVNDLEQQIGTKQGTTVTLNGTPQATFEGGGLIDENDTIIFSGGEA